MIERLYEPKDSYLEPHGKTLAITLPWTLLRRPTNKRHIPYRHPGAAPNQEFFSMSRSLNKVMLIGNVGNDPEIRATSSGTRVGKVSLATNRSWTDRSGAKAEKTEWHRLTFFGRLVDIVEQYVKKGDRLYVEGRIEYSQTEGDNGPKYWTDIVITEVVMLGSSGGALPTPSGGEFSGGGPATPGSETDDDLPF